MDLSMTTATPGFDGAESLINQQVLERVEPLEGRITLTSLALAAITVDATTQPRVAVDRAVVYDYAEAMRAGAKFPPIKVIFDGTTYWLIDGFPPGRGGGRGRPH